MMTRAMISAREKTSTQAAWVLSEVTGIHPCLYGDMSRTSIALGS